MKHKLLLSLGTAAAVVFPIASVVACGTTEPNKNNGNVEPGKGALPSLAADSIKISDEGTKYLIYKRPAIISWFDYSLKVEAADAVINKTPFIDWDPSEKLQSINKDALVQMLDGQKSVYIYNFTKTVDTGPYVAPHQPIQKPVVPTVWDATKHPKPPKFTDTDLEAIDKDPNPQLQTITDYSLMIVNRPDATTEEFQTPYMDPKDPKYMGVIPKDYQPFKSVHISDSMNTFKSVGLITHKVIYDASTGKIIAIMDGNNKILHQKEVSETDAVVSTREFEGWW